MQYRLLAIGLSTGALAAAAPADDTSLPMDRRWQVLPAPAEDSAEAYRAVFRRAGELLGDWTVQLAGIALDGPKLIALADRAPGEPFVRVVREELRRPFDLPDLAFFLDDVLAAGDAGLRGKLVWVTAGRARAAGITIHPDDVFEKQPRLYGAEQGGRLNIDEPARPAQLPPAVDGDPLGPNWSARYENPETEDGMFAILERQSPSGTYAERVRSLRDQINAQGGEFYVFTTVRNRNRGYLMWGAYMLSRLTSAAAVKGGIRKLESRNRQWGLDVPIQWRHPEGWRANVEAARAMSEAYDVVYATEDGAKDSNHYGGRAIDLAGLALPRTFTLEAPDGAKHTFDLSDPESTRDLNLSPEVIGWIEEHFHVRKLKSDYPHWDDTAPDRAVH